MMKSQNHTNMLSFLDENKVEQFAFDTNVVRLKDGKIVTIKSASDTSFEDMEGNIHIASEIIGFADEDKPVVKIREARKAEPNSNIYSAMADFNRALAKFDKPLQARTTDAAHNAISHVYDYLAGRDNVNGEDTIDNAIWLLLQVKELARQGKDSRKLSK